MLNTILKVIDQIPDLISQKTLQVDFLKDQLATLQPQQVIVIGSGSSYNAAAAAKVFNEEQNLLNFELYYPNFFLNHLAAQAINQQALYIFISQGGRTKSVLQSLKKVKDQGGVTLSLTESLTAPIAQTAQYAIEIGSENEPFIFRTAGYTMTVVTLDLISLILAKNQGLIDQAQLIKNVAELNKLPQTINQVINLTKNWYKQEQTALLAVNSYFFAGGGSLWPTAQEAEIKFMEMIPAITNSYEIEEIIHGPQNCFSPDTAYFLMANERNDLIKAQEIKDFVKNEITSSVYLFSNKSSQTVDLAIATESGNVSGLVYVTACQVLSYLIAQAKGRDLTQTRYPQITRYINKAI